MFVGPSLKAETLPIMVILVDDGDGARVQVDPEEVGPHLHAALQFVILLNRRHLSGD